MVEWCLVFCLCFFGFGQARGMVDVEPSDDSAVAAGLMTNEHGLEYVKLVHPDTGASSDVYLYGGVVTSYVADGVEYIAGMSGSFL